MERAFAAWLRLGSSEAAERETGVAAGTMRRWKLENPERFRTVQRAHDAALVEYRARLASEAWEAMSEALGVLRGLMRTAPAERDRIASARAVTQLAVETDKVVRLDRGAPTDITELQDTPQPEQVLADREALIVEARRILEAESEAGHV